MRKYASNCQNKFGIEKWLKVEVKFLLLILPQKTVLRACRTIITNGFLPTARMISQIVVVVRIIIIIDM